MPERDALFNFLDTGILGPIEPGMTTQQIIDLLGIPSYTQIFHPPFETYSYEHWLELTFNGGILEHISLRYKWQKRLKKRFKLSGIFAAPWTRSVASWNYLRFRSLFHSNGRTFRRLIWSDGSYTLEISTGGSVTLGYPKRMGLYSINYGTGEFGRRLNGTILCAPSNVFHWSRHSSGKAR